MTWLRKKFQDANKTWEKDKLAREEMARRARFKAETAWKEGAPARDAAAKERAVAEFEQAFERWTAAQARWPDLALDDEAPVDAQDDPTPAPSRTVPQADGDSQATTGEPEPAPTNYARPRVEYVTPTPRTLPCGCRPGNGSCTTCQPGELHHLTPEQQDQFRKDVALYEARKAAQ